MSRDIVRSGGSVDASRIGIAAVLLVAAIACLLRVAGAVSAALTGVPLPTGGLETGLAVLTDPTSPGVALRTPQLSPVVYWAVAGVLASVLVVVTGSVAWRVRSHRLQRIGRLENAAGTAARAQIRRTASARSLLARAGVLRPALESPAASDVGYLLGASRGEQVWASVEDSILVFGPPRSGKGSHLVINMILDAPGAVVTTSTRTDNLTATIRARQRRGGPVVVFDPQGLADGAPSELRWSPIRGCERPLTAMIRAAGLASATRLSSGGVEGGSFWEGKTRTALQCLLHAAALEDRSVAELFRWTLDPAAALDAASILAGHPDAAAGWADALSGMLGADPRTRDSIWQGVSLSLSGLADPRVLAAVSPGPDEVFDPEAFLRESGTLYLVATGSGAGATGPLVAAFVEDMVEAARRVAARSPNARLDPPLLLALDEIANLAPLPSLPTLIAEGGGTGITTMPVLQSLSQARNRWGDAAATAIWDASIVKVILHGITERQVLADLSAVIGDRDDVTESYTFDARGSYTRQQSTRRVPVAQVDQIRTMPEGVALVLYRSARPIMTRLRHWTSRPDGAALQADRRQLEADLQRAAGDRE